MIEKIFSWTYFKKFLNEKKNSTFQYTENDDFYYLEASDSTFTIECLLNKNNPNEDLNDFLTNYKDQVTKTPQIQIVPTTPKNDHTMQPWGALKFQFTSSDYACPITLSNKSEDGLTFNYNSDVTFTPRVGDYIWQNNFCLRYWITSVNTDTYTITLDQETVRPRLENGASHYSKGVWIDCDIPDWYSPMYLWGLSAKCFWNTSHIGKNDFVELSIVDTNDFFKDDTFCQEVFGCTATEAIPIITNTLGFEQNGEYGHWTKYYDESMVVNITDRTIFTPDGSPGEILPHFSCRISYFTSLTDSTLNEIFLDYFATAKV